MLRQCHTAIIERNQHLTGRFVTEPYECGWASEAIFFVRKLEASGSVEGSLIKAQISPDGMRWCDEGATVSLSKNEVDFCKVTHFGNWLRLEGHLPAEADMTVIITLCLKE